MWYRYLHERTDARRRRMNLIKAEIELRVKAE